MRSLLICLLIVLFVHIDGTSQVKMFPIKDFKLNIDLPIDSKVSKVDSAEKAPFFNTNFHSLPKVSSITEAYYTHHLGFFCKKELQLESTLKVPIRFRLGSVAYTDQMEGKGRGKLQ